MDKRKIGKIYLSRELINWKKDWKEAQKILSLIGFFPVRVEYLAWNDTLEMIGYSDKFDEVEPGYQPPTYVLTVIRVGKDIKTVKVLRLNKSLEGNYVERVCDVCGGNKKTT